MNRNTKRPIPWLFLAGSLFAVACFLIMRWAINTEHFGARDLGLATALAFSLPLLSYGSVILALIELFLAITCRKGGKDGAPMLLCAALIALLPLFLR